MPAEHEARAVKRAAVTLGIIVFIGIHCENLVMRDNATFIYSQCVCRAFIRAAFRNTSYNLQTAVNAKYIVFSSA